MPAGSEVIVWKWVCAVRYSSNEWWSWVTVESLVSFLWVNFSMTKLRIISVMSERSVGCEVRAGISGTIALRAAQADPSKARAQRARRVVMVLREDGRLMLAVTSFWRQMPQPRYSRAME